MGNVFAYGDRDDPARLVVLLADRVLAVSDPASAAARNARTSLEPRTPWRTRLFAPECWPIASWLVDRGVLRPRDLIEVERTVDRADEHLVDLAYEALPDVAREAALLLTVLRAPQPLNGHYGA